MIGPPFAESKTLKLLPEQIAWVAGVIEGEGYIGIRRATSRGSDSVVTRIVVRMTDKDIIERLHHLVPGSFFLSVPPQKSHYKPQWQFHVTDRELVAELLTLIVPWLGKRRGSRAMEVLAWIANNPVRHADLKGTKNPSAKINEADVAAIRSAKGHVSAIDLANRYGLHWAQIYAIWSRHSWKHVP